ncbi:MAG: hypothetical protein DMF54_04535 [Acidobacteria bacterium]|nr:MAG: hypothetical protein DMF54_04535 [Acidobacteriota bacterium]
MIGTLLLALPAFLAGAQQPSLPAAPAGRQDLVVTNQNLGVVVESRSVSLPAGRFELRWEGTPAAARTETWTVTNAREARIRWLGLSGPLPGTGAADSEWLRGLVGKHVRIARPGGSTAEAEVLAVYGATAAPCSGKALSSFTASPVRACCSGPSRARPPAPTESSCASTASAPETG